MAPYHRAGAFIMCSAVKQQLGYWTSNNEIKRSLTGSFCGYYDVTQQSGTFYFIKFIKQCELALASDDALSETGKVTAGPEESNDSPWFMLNITLWLFA